MNLGQCGPRDQAGQRPHGATVQKPATIRIHQDTTRPLWRNRGSMLGARPRKASKDAAAGREPPTAIISSRYRWQVAGSNTSRWPSGPVEAASSKAAKASADKTSAHL